MVLGIGKMRCLAILGFLNKNPCQIILHSVNKCQAVEKEDSKYLGSQKEGAQNSENISSAY